MVEFRYSAIHFDVNFMANFMKYRGYYGTFEIHDTFSTIPEDAVIVLGNQLVTVRDLTGQETSSDSNDVTYERNENTCVNLTNDPCDVVCTYGYRTDTYGCQLCECATEALADDVPLQTGWVPRRLN